ncbi:MAG TPA: inositol-3-phosphate synthase, partial [Candidatus Brocadiales bacterium]|nr:inositol-3-phosphate synthase [Candidatus Brocadiales bacterium]
KRGIGKPIGSLTQLGTIRLGKRTERNVPRIKDFIPLADLSNIAFGGWDIFNDNIYEAAIKAGVLRAELLDDLRAVLEDIDPMPAVFDKKFVKRLNGKNLKKGKTKMDLAEQLIEDISNFRKGNKLDRMVMVWCGSTETYIEASEVHKSIRSFEMGLKDNNPDIAPSMIYAYAAIKSGVPYANGAPNLSVDIPALIELAKVKKVPIAGKDFKTGQTLMKTILAPGLKNRMIGVRGWFSTNILGNRDGEVLDDPYSFKTKEVSKLGVLEYIFQPELYPDLYSDYYHKVRINYYPPRGDEKEAWDNIDIFGWLGYPMQIKVNFLCRDSILAAPIVLDLVLFMDLAQRANL